MNTPNDVLRDPTPAYDREFFEKAREMHFECVKKDFDEGKMHEPDR